MPIQWFPGHMNSTKKAINPLLAALTRGKSAWKVLNRQDMADHERTALWLSATGPSRVLVLWRWTPV